MDQDSKPHSAFVIATTPDWFQMRPGPLADGTLFTSADKDEQLCVLAERQRKAIFGERQAVGETILVADVPFKVVGVLKEEEGSALFGDSGFEDVIFLPAAVVEEKIPHTQINRILIQTDPKVSPDLALDEISRRRWGRYTDGHEDFGVLAPTAIAWNHLQVDVDGDVAGGRHQCDLSCSRRHRHHEYHARHRDRAHPRDRHRKAVGAKKQDILCHLVVEALVISFLENSAGLASAIGIGEIREPELAAEATPQRQSGPPFPGNLRRCRGLIFGTAPALRASRLRPIDSLRRE